MKYASISIEKGSINLHNGVNASDRVVNIGDQAQLIAIDNLYDYMGVPKEKIIYIEYYDLSTYDGEYVVLPINFILFNPFYGDKEIMFSSKIIPVFLGIHCVNNLFSNSEIAWLKRYEPIGCRDEVTMNGLRERGVDAFLHGCLTVTLPKRQSNVQANKTYLVDVPDSLLSFIPNRIMANSIKKSHQYYGVIDGEVNGKSMKGYMQERFAEYCAYAELVITSRLHCAVPCLAMGIPVIFVSEEYNPTFSWIEKFIPVYTKDRYSEIDWSPNSVDIEDIKARILEHDARRIKSVYEKYADTADISQFFESKVTKDNNYIRRLKSYIESNWNKVDNIEYVVWGVTQIAYEVVEFIKYNYPQARLVGVVDEFRDLVFQGHTTIRSAELLKHRDWKIIATGNSSSIALSKFCTEHNYMKGDYFSIFPPRFEDYSEGVK